MRRFAGAPIALWGTLLISVAVNGLQGSRILRLEEALDGRGGSATLRHGERMLALYLRDESGHEVVLRPASIGKPVLIYVFSPFCIWCERNAGSFDALVRGARDNFHIIPASLAAEGIGEFKIRHRITLPIYTALPSTMEAYHLGETPTTIMLSRDGDVLNVWRGAYTGETKASIERSVHARLPDV